MEPLNKPNFNDDFRSNQSEIMDSVAFGGTEMKYLIRDISTVNRWLGGNSITFKGINRLLRSEEVKEITILDVGCADGGNLQKVIAHLEQKGIKTSGIGIDFNENILAEATTKYSLFHNLHFQKVDVLKQPDAIPQADIVILSLFLHHLNDDEIIFLLNHILSKTTIGIVVNDLSRNKMAFNLFKLFSFFFLKTKTAAYDGLVSIARGFKRSELLYFSKHIPNQHSTVTAQWAFRYLWILHKKQQ